MSKQFGLIGHPVKHSLSPWIHEQFLRKANLEGSYTLIEISPADDFSEKMNDLKQMELNGFNVTVPYKEKIIPYLDHTDELARKMGAVNTVVNRDGKWTGYNTDGIGYLRALTGKFPHLTDESRILLLGAGGAARGIYYALIQAGFIHIDIANRTETSARKIASPEKERANTSVLTLSEAAHQLGEYDVIIQTTSVGMSPVLSESIIETDQLNPDSIVSDIVYQPLKTELLKQAEEKGASIHLGHTMLLYQAQYAFEIWTGMKVPLGDMDHQLQNILEGR